MKRILVLLLLFVATHALAADDLERSVAMMARIGNARSPSFSPDGKRVAFLTSISGSPQVWVMSSEGGWPDQVTALDDPVTAMEWSPDGQWLALQVAPGGGLNTQIYVVALDGTHLRRLTAGGKENNWLGRWSRDSKSLAYSSNGRSSDAMDAWRLDVASGKSSLIAENSGIGTVEHISADSRYALINRLRSRGDNDLFRVPMSGGAEVLLSRHTPPGEFGGQFGASGDVVYMAGNPERDLGAFLRVDIAADGKPGPMRVIASRDDAELNGFEVNDAGTLALLDWNVAGRSELSLIDLVTNKQRQVRKLPGDIAGGFTFSRDGSKLAFTIGGANRPADIWVMDVASGAMRQLTRSPHPGVDLASLVRPELLTYTTDDGVKLSGWLYRPVHAKPPYATVLSFHGGPEGQERPSFNSTYQAMAASGLAVFAPNVRGSSGFGKRFVNLDNGALRVGSVRDIKASADFLTARNIADPKRLGIMGGSYGGYMVMAGVTEYPDLFAGGADLFGVVNFETFFKHSEPWMAAISKVEYGDPVTQAEMLYSLSPIHKIDRVKTPLIVLHGANDTNVPVIEAEQVVNSLKSRGVPVEYILFPDEGHGWQKTVNRIRSTVALTRFFVERLQAK